MYLVGVGLCVDAILNFLESQGMLPHGVLTIKPDPRNANQQRLAPMLPSLKSKLRTLPPGVTEAMANWSATPLNQILAQRGYTIQLAPWPVDRRQLGAVSILRQQVTWQHKGQAVDESTQMPYSTTYQNATYRAFQLKQGFSVGGVYPSHPILTLHTLQDEKVFVQMVDEPVSGFDLVDACEEMVNEAKTRDFTAKYSAALVPHVTYDSELTAPIDLSWLQGLVLASEADAWQIAQALQQLKLAWDENGAVVEAGTAMSAKRSSSFDDRDVFVLDKPFIVHFVNSGFMAYIDQRSWRLMEATSSKRLLLTE